MSLWRMKTSSFRASFLEGYRRLDRMRAADPGAIVPVRLPRSDTLDENEMSTVFYPFISVRVQLVEIERSKNIPG